MTMQVFSESDDMGRPLAMVVLTIPDGVGKTTLSGLMVAESEQRQGRASRVIAKAEVVAKESGATQLFAVTHPDNKAARALFSKMGYKEMIQLEKAL